ncbi:murein biosynthesis integral membrane protein MurJ [Catellatospora tritici]|uniref:murein biosynthesis integral membrane protein MurJ n=1 Tax=Catellatospora tritici TaxID=2851566 RepID=UPI001C2D39A6|nr:murein biosynthesis integral membrane protein MurJ [Catellatospora tritici]MBV1851239.1 murein biosynthesis integral membrane protein MurJ [Catellatospora tritici]
MAVATLVSRLAGFLRIVVLAAALGMGTRLLDSYNVANTLPNAVYELVVGGAMASVVVPLLARAALTEPDDGVEYAQRLLTLMVYGLAAITLAALVAAPLLVELYTPGFTAGQRDQAVVFSRYFLPQILFYGVSATAAAVLNIRGRFAVPMWAPFGNSVVVIAVGLIYLAVDSGAMTDGQMLLLAIGTTAGVFVQMSLVVWALARSGFPLRPRWDPRGIAIRRIGRLGGWVLLSVVAGQALLVMATRAASLSGPGGITAYQSAYAVFQVPFAVIAVSVMTAMLPRLSRNAARLDHDLVIGDLSRAVRVASVAMAPIAVAMVVLGQQLATLLFANSRSVASTVSMLGVVVTAFGFALVPFTGYMILQRGFYALQDTRTPALITASVAAIGVTGCAAAMWLLPPADIVIGIPLVYALAYTVGLLVTAAVLRRRLGRIDGRRLLRTHLRALGAAAVGAACAVLAVRTLAPVVASDWVGSVAVIVVAGPAGAVGYFVAGRLLQLTELRQLATMTLGGIRPH